MLQKNIVVETNKYKSVTFIIIDWISRLASIFFFDYIYIDERG